MYEEKVERMIRFGVLYLQLLELFVNSVVHLAYGFYIFSSAVSGDLYQAFRECCILNERVVQVEPGGEGGGGAKANDLPPIVLVHGIFGFGKGVSLKLARGYRFVVWFSIRGVANDVACVFGLFVSGFVCRNWEACRTSQAQRRRTRGSWCRIWDR